MKIINPATEEIIADIQIDDKTSIDDKLKRLKTGQKKWAALPVNERLDRIVSFGGLVKENINELASVLTSETGKPLQQSFNEISGAQNRIDHLKSNAVKWLREELIVDGDTSEKLYMNH
jgi:acyl-CoA reductase-like NAD-dependent aldehyde dehydrogenase